MELKSLGEIFNEKFFRIPDYQRGYSWGMKQWEDLWRDIDILEENKDHYTGVLSVIQPKERTKKGHIQDIPADETLFVVDGQQRITTLIILIKEIWDTMNDSEDKERKQQIKNKYISVKRDAVYEPVFGYKTDRPSNVYFKTEILGLSSTETAPQETLYTHNLKKAKEFFNEKVRDLLAKNPDKLEILFKKVTKHLKFNYYKIDDNLSEFVTFETMNNRGKPLSDLERLKNRLIYLSTLLSENSEANRDYLRNDINNAWKTIYEYLGKNVEKNLNDDDFLRDHWIMNFPYSRNEAKSYKKDLLNEYFTVERIGKELKYETIKEYVEDIQKSIKSYYFLHNPNDTQCRYDEKIKKGLSKLNRLGFGAFKPLLTSMLTKNEKIDNSDLMNVLKHAEWFNFVAFNVLFRQSNYKNNGIYRAAYKFHKSDSGLNIDRFIQKSLPISNIMAKDIFCDDINRKYPKEKFYKWKGLHYFLYEYELHLQGEDKKENKVEWEKINTETIEHIYPQKPENGWTNLFSSEEDKKLMHDLGNLLLLRRKLNSKIKNGSFNKKREAFEEDSHSAIKVSKYLDWNPLAVRDRRNKMLVFLWERWGLEEPAKKED